MVVLVPLGTLGLVAGCKTPRALIITTILLLELSPPAFLSLCVIRARVRTVQIIALG